MKILNTYGEVILQVNAKSLMNGTLENLNLQFADFSGMNLRAVKFKNCNLYGANFENSDLSFASFSNGDNPTILRCANLKNAALFYTNFNGADLGFANLELTKLYYSDIETANLNGAITKGAVFKDPCAIEETCAA